MSVQPAARRPSVIFGRQLRPADWMPPSLSLSQMASELVTSPDFRTRRAPVADDGTDSIPAPREGDASPHRE